MAPWGPRQSSTASREPPTLQGARGPCHPPSLPSAASVLLLLGPHQERRWNHQSVESLERAHCVRPLTTLLHHGCGSEALPFRVWTPFMFWTWLLLGQLGPVCGRPGSGLTARLFPLRAWPHQTRCPPPATSPVSSTHLRHQGEIPWAVRRSLSPEPGSAGAGSPLEGSTCSPTRSPGSGWGPGSLVGEGTCLLSLHLQQACSVERSLEGRPDPASNLGWQLPTLSLSSLVHKRRGEVNP